MRFGNVGGKATFGDTSLGVVVRESVVGVGLNTILDAVDVESRELVSLFTSFSACFLCHFRLFGNGLDGSDNHGS